MKCSIECAANDWAGVYDLQYRAIEGDSPVHYLLATVYGGQYLNSIPLEWNMKWC